VQKYFVARHKKEEFTVAGFIHNTRTGIATRIKAKITAQQKNICGARQVAVELADLSRYGQNRDQ
jgi:hypothetical protein